MLTALLDRQVQQSIASSTITGLQEFSKLVSSINADEVGEAKVCIRDWESRASSSGLQLNTSYLLVSLTQPLH